jgi:hypothetical protein
VSVPDDHSLCQFCSRTEGVAKGTMRRCEGCARHLLLGEFPLARPHADGTRSPMRYCHECMGKRVGKPLPLEESLRRAEMRRADDRERWRRRKGNAVECDCGRSFGSPQAWGQHQKHCPVRNAA